MSTEGKAPGEEGAPAYITRFDGVRVPATDYHIVANYRPRSTLLLLSRLIGEHFAGSPYGEYFASSAPE